MKKIFPLAYLAILVLLTSLSLAEERFSISVDAAQFAGTNKETYLEIYYSIPENGPIYKKLSDGRYECDVLMNLHIYQNDSLWSTKIWRLNGAVADTAVKDDKKQMVDLLRYPLNPGRDYRVVLYARDMVRDKLDSAEIELSGLDFNSDVLLLSDVQLANTIQPFDSACPPAFHKRIYCITPNPEITFGGKFGVMYYYFEGYHLLKNFPAGSFMVRTRILDGVGELCQQIPTSQQMKKVRQDMCREMGQFDISSLPSGLYELQCTISDSTGQQAVATQKAFLVRNPGVKLVGQNIASAPVADYRFLEGLDAVTLDNEFDRMYAILSKKDREMYRNFKEVTGKKNYLYQLWASLRNPEFPNPEDFRNNYLQRVKFVEGKFKKSFKPAWKTDQGMCYLRYGQPSDIERHPSSNENVPYEIWRYEQLENGVYFVFIDRFGSNAFELIHSTKRGEMYDPNWQRQLAPVSDSQFKM